MLFDIIKRVSCASDTILSNKSNSRCKEGASAHCGVDVTDDANGTANSALRRRYSTNSQKRENNDIHKLLRDYSEGSIVAASPIYGWAMDLNTIKSNAMSNTGVDDISSSHDASTDTKLNTAQVCYNPFKMYAIDGIQYLAVAYLGHIYAHQHLESYLCTLYSKRGNIYSSSSYLSLFCVSDTIDKSSGNTATDEQISKKGIIASSYTKGVPAQVCYNLLKLYTISEIPYMAVAYLSDMYRPQRLDSYLSTFYGRSIHKDGSYLSLLYSSDSTANSCGSAAAESQSSKKAVITSHCFGTYPRSLFLQYYSSSDEFVRSLFRSVAATNGTKYIKALYNPTVHDEATTSELNSSKKAGKQIHPDIHCSLLGKEMIGVSGALVMDDIYRCATQQPKALLKATSKKMELVQNRNSRYPTSLFL